MGKVTALALLATAFALLLLPPNASASTTPWQVTLDLSDTEVAPGETVTYSGSVTTEGGAAGSGTVTVQKRRAGTSTWSNWRTKTLAADGSYAVNVAMTTADREWQFRAKMPGNAGNTTGFSPTKNLTVLPPQPWVVTLALSDDEVSPGTTVTYSGSVKSAAGSNGTGTVTLQKRRLGGSWSNWRTKKLSASGTYAINVAMTTADREWQFRTRMLASGTNLKGFSPVKDLTVLPPKPWVVTLTLSDDEISAGETVTYSGSVKSAGGANGSGTVTVQKRRAGATSWSNWRTKKLSSGSYAVNVAMTTADREWEFRAKMPGNASNLTGFSSKKTLTVLPLSPWVVTLTLSESEVAPGETVTYSGSVKSAGGTNGTGTVTLQKRRAGATSWSNWRTKTLSSGKYTIDVAMTTADREWQFRTRMLASGANLKGFSPVKDLTVLPL